MSFAERLIDEVKSHEIIYNVSSANKKNLLAKELVWRDISRRLGVSEKQARKKWKNLRDVYRRSKQQLNLWKSNGAEGKRTEWKFYQKMRFLDTASYAKDPIGNTEKILNIFLPEMVESSQEVLLEEYSSPTPLDVTTTSESLTKNELEAEQGRYEGRFDTDSFQQPAQPYSDSSCSSTRQLFDALALRVMNSGLTNDETGIVELAVTECVINKIREIKSTRSSKGKCNECS